MWQLPGVGISAFIPDVLHVAHLGVYRRIYGSVLKYLTHRKLAESVETNVARVWVEIQAAYQAAHFFK